MDRLEAAVSQPPKRSVQVLNAGRPTAACVQHGGDEGLRCRKGRSASEAVEHPAARRRVHPGRLRLKAAPASAPRRGVLASLGHDFAPLRAMRHLDRAVIGSDEHLLARPRDKQRRRRVPLSLPPAAIVMQHARLERSARDVELRAVNAEIQEVSPQHVQLSRPRCSAVAVQGAEVAAEGWARQLGDERWRLGKVLIAGRKEVQKLPTVVEHALPRVGGSLRKPVLRTPGHRGSRLRSRSRSRSPTAARQPTAWAGDAKQRKAKKIHYGTRVSYTQVLMRSVRLRSVPIMRG